MNTTIDTTNSGSVSCYLSKDARDQIREHCLVAGENEWAGILAARPARLDPRRTVLAALRLPARVSRSHATLDPLAAAAAEREVIRAGLVPVGYVHGHGAFDVFHSGTDRETEQSTLVSFAEYDWQHIGGDSLAPVVLAPDVAAVGNGRGQRLLCRLIGAVNAHGEPGLLSEWTSREIEFPGSDVQTVAFDGARLTMEGNGVCLRPGVPRGSTLEIASEEASPVRVASLFSVVANRADAICASHVRVRDVNGERTVEVRQCPVVVDDVPGTSPGGAAIAVAVALQGLRRLLP